MDRATQKIDMPGGGIGDFIYTDEELDIIEAKELEEAFGKDGIAQFKDVSKKIAEYGRYGDDTVAHVETGELIVPRALIENNPELKESIFSHLKELGVEDPERYVVGTKKNSINPDTGLPEFFLSKLFKGIGKGVSKIGKGVSRAFKGVGKALKKAAPIILPVALNVLFPGLGAVYSGAIGSGIATLLQGGKLDDAFKSALVGGATGALTAGFAGEGTFGQNVMADVSTGTSNIGSAFQGDFSGLQARTVPSLRDLGGSSTDTVRGDAVRLDKVGIEKLDPIKTADIDVTVGKDNFGEFDPLIPKKPTMYESLKSGASNFGDYIMPDKKSFVDVLKEKNIDPLKATEAQIKVAKEIASKEGPGFLRRYGPTAGLAGLGLYAAGAFDAPEQERLNIPESGLDVYNRSPETYNVAGMTPNLATGPFKIPTNYTFNYTPYRLPTDPFKKGDPPVFIPPFQRAAEGGEIFPRRNGGIGPNEGTPGKDSVRAMLMPGEFVMTTDAVKGLGNGDLNTGIKNMYSVMSKLEKKGKAMA
tara:strand:- start:5463 stop:7055 length:1593 start_codon:yes stop_codon:yes gene_type:complete